MHSDFKAFLLLSPSFSFWIALLNFLIFVLFFPCSRGSQWGLHVLAITLEDFSGDQTAMGNLELISPTEPPQEMGFDTIPLLVPAFQVLGKTISQLRALNHLGLPQLLQGQTS